MIKSRTIAKALISMTEDDGINSEKIAESFLNFVERNNLAHQLPTIMFHLKLENKRREKERELSITLTEEVSPNLLDRIREYVGASQKTKVRVGFDKGIIGGFIAKHRNKLYDASLESHLGKLRVALKSN
jgi:F0F1-type ATP synthase delta subunit